MKPMILTDKKSGTQLSLFSMVLWLLLVFLTLWARPVSAQNAPDRISTDKEDAWMSCTPGQNPNPARGVSHWIRYDLGFERQLNKSTFWNLNHPDHLNSGVREFAIDISSNGTTWTHLGNFTLAKANASGFYSGIAGPDFNNATGRYLLFTALSNYGGPCYGLAEIRIEAAQALPVDFTDVWIDCGNNEILWTVENQRHNRGFTVQRSDDGLHWTDMGFVPVSPGDNGKYSYAASPPALTGYIRVQQTDHDGSYTVSQTKKANCILTSTLVVRPNPAADVITVEGRQTLAGEVYRIADVNGRVVRTGRFLPGSSIPVVGLIPGLYVISTGSDLFKFVKM